MKYKGYEIDIEDASGETDHMLRYPLVYIVGTDGVTKFEYVNPDYKEGIDIDMLVEAAKAALTQRNKWFYR